jgi:hypothetical protein
MWRICCRKTVINCGKSLGRRRGIFTFAGNFISQQFYRFQF